MTPQGNKPSCHDVITGAWTPTLYDLFVGRVPGYGVTTNIINGGLECGQPYNPDAVSKVESRIAFYERYCDLLGLVDPGDNLDCYTQQPFGNALVNINPRYGSHIKMPVDKA